MKICEKCGKELQDNEVCSCEVQVQSWTNENQQTTETETVIVEQPKRKRGLNIATSIIYPLIFLIITLAFFKNGLTSPVGLVLSILSLAGSVACILYSGFYLIIIPLPIVFLFKYGCQRPELPTWKKVVFGLLAVVLLFLPMVFTSIL